MFESKYNLTHKNHLYCCEHNFFQSNVTVDVGGHTTIVPDRKADENQESSETTEANKWSMKRSSSLFISAISTGARPKKSTSAQVML